MHSKQRNFTYLLSLLALACFFAVKPGMVKAETNDAQTVQVDPVKKIKKTFVAYNRGNKLNIWSTYGKGKKVVTRYKSGRKFTATGQVKANGKNWYRISSKKWINGVNAITTTKYNKIKAVAAKASKQKKVVALASSKLGKRYVWGATGPYSFDCSGLTMYVYKHALGVNLPHYSVSQLYYGKTVSTKKLQKGDLLFFGSKRAPSHVGIYVGGNKFVHASSPTVGVIKSTVSTRPSSVFYPSSARRLI